MSEDELEYAFSVVSVVSVDDTRCWKPMQVVLSHSGLAEGVGLVSCVILGEASVVLEGAGEGGVVFLVTLAFLVLTGSLAMYAQQHVQV